MQCKTILLQQALFSDPKFKSAEKSVKTAPTKVIELQNQALWTVLLR